MRSPDSCTDPRAAATLAGLRYSTDDAPGLRRVRAGGGFRYLRPGRRAERSVAALARIRSLAIPPAWTDVWICKDPRGHLQATGRDRRGRKQYRYHQAWRAIRDRTKFHRIAAFARTLPCIRGKVARDLRRRGLKREKILATVVALLDRTHQRVGNEEYAKENGSYGLTTLRDHHAQVRGATVLLRFRGKSGRQQQVSVHDQRIATIVRRSGELPGQELFRYVCVEGRTHAVCSHDVNDYIRAVTGGAFTSKDFRTWGGTVAAAQLLRERSRSPRRSPSALRRIEAEVVARVAALLGNRPATCRTYYIDPRVFAAYESGKLVRAMSGGKDPERAVLELLK